MKQFYLIGILLANIFLLSSCEKEASLEDLQGTWFRSHPFKVSGGNNQPSFERGEAHITITFLKNGDFIHNRTVFGAYEGTTIDDENSIVIESGTYKIDEDKIEIVLDKRIWKDSFYGDMEDFEESGVNTNKYKDMSFEIVDEELKVVYFIETDLISEEQETPGLDKFEEVFTKQ